MVLPDNSEDGDDDCDEERPDESRDGVEVVAEQLQAKTRGVVDGDVVAEDGECEQHQTEFAPA